MEMPLLPQMNQFFVYCCRKIKVSFDCEYN